jgi:limonene-1,2-epoxide hydrolase
MTNALVPEVRTAAEAGSDPQSVVETFLVALTKNDFETAGALVADDIVWVNVGLPTIRGRRAVLKAMAPLAKFGDCFEVYLHRVAAADGSVLTERTDVLNFGPVRLQFWVWGRFDVRAGRITLWRDAFDFVDMVKALVRGLLGAAVPAIRPKAPTSPRQAPGRH